jgi:hypothetical protein
LAAKYGSEIDFICVYIDEAHPIESGDFAADSGVLQMNEHKTMEDRMDCAKDLTEHVKLPIYVDHMENRGCLEYAALPERYVYREIWVLVHLSPFNSTLFQAVRFAKLHSVHEGWRGTAQFHDR